MKLDDSESELLKQWVMQRLEGIEVDGDVMADYVLALVKTDDPEPVLRANSIENLQDFLQDGTEAFVNDLFAAIQTGSYDPSKAAPAPVPVQQELQPFESRKRAFDDDNAQTGRIHSYEGGDRPVKQMRRGGGRGGHNAHGGQFAQPPMHQQQPWQAPQMPQMPQMGQMPAPPPGMPPYDPNDPMSMFLAMQQAMGMQGMPGMPPMPGAPATQKKPGRRCFDYDRKGFCARGASCPYEHGEEAIVAPPADQYDPSNSALPGFPPVDQFDSGRGGARGRGRGRGGNFRGGGRRADISIQGQNYDRSNTTIVVEQIPEDKFDEQIVRDFFNEFGNIEEVGLQPYRRLATVKYDSYDAAKAAYDSPKVIFDNRFVKVYWHKSDSPNKPHAAGGEADVEMKEQDPQIDPEEFAKRQEEAQRKHDEALKQRAETEKQRSDVDAKIKAMEAEKKKLAEMLAKKGGKLPTPAAPSPAANGNAAQDDPKGLQQQLAKLEAEAHSLGINPEDTSIGWAGSSGYRGRGGLHGRGGYRGRGYNPGFRGGYGAPRGGAVKRLDNRPRTVMIVFPSGTYDQHNEALSQYLLLSNNLEHAELSKHPERSDAALLAFEERYRAENFKIAAATSSGIPHVGQVELSWQPNPPVTVSSNGNGANGNDGQDDYKMDVSEPAAPVAESIDAFDVADDPW